LIVKQAEQVAVRVGERGHPAPTAAVVRILLHDGTRGSHLDQFRRDVQPVPVGDR